MKKIAMLLILCFCIPAVADRKTKTITVVVKTKRQAEIDEIKEEIERSCQSRNHIDLHLKLQEAIDNGFAPPTELPVEWLAKWNNVWSGHLHNTCKEARKAEKDFDNNPDVVLIWQWLISINFAFVDENNINQVVDKGFKRVNNEIIPIVRKQIHRVWRRVNGQMILVEETQ